MEKKNYHEELIRVVNYPDYMLYEHFNETFWSKVEKVGLKKLEKIVVEIQEYSKMYQEKCVERYQKKKSWNGQLISEPVLKKSKSHSKICKWMVLWGNDQSEELKVIQRKIISEWV